MNKYTGLIIASAIVVLIQFTGFPSSWREGAIELGFVVHNSQAVHEVSEVTFPDVVRTSPF